MIMAYLGIQVKMNLRPIPAPSLPAQAHRGRPARPDPLSDAGSLGSKASLFAWFFSLSKEEGKFRWRATRHTHTHTPALLPRQEQMHFAFWQLYLKPERTQRRFPRNPGQPRRPSPTPVCLFIYVPVAVFGDLHSSAGSGLEESLSSPAWDSFPRPASCGGAAVPRRPRDCPAAHLSEAAPPTPTPPSAFLPVFDFPVRVSVCPAKSASPFVEGLGSSRRSCSWVISSALSCASLSGPHPTKPKTMVHCAGCKRPILDRFLLNVLDRAWHVKCVQCCECKCNLTEKCFSREGKLYCKNDFFRWVLLPSRAAWAAPSPRALPSRLRIRGQRGRGDPRWELPLERGS